jgi:glutamine synthetase
MRVMPDTQKSLPKEAADFLEAHPGTTTIDAVFADLSGVVRGKRYPIAQIGKLFGEGIAFPGSVFLLSASGDSQDPKGRGFSDGDPDEVAKVIPGTLHPVPWSDRPVAQVLLTLQAMDGTPFPFEPRNVLKTVLARIAELNLRPVIAFELEFYLIDRERLPSGAPQPPRSPVTGQRDLATQVYGMAAVDDFADFLEAAAQACAAQGVQIGATSSEYAPGQFEINLQHLDDPLLATDHCVMFKRAVQGVARRHSVQATFMAKPYLESAGSGMHLHISLLDDKGHNVFDGGKEPASETLLHAMGGILNLLPESMAILAPNPNSYRRFRPNIFVPVSRSWGYENRSTTIRIPIGGGAARRIEHRMAGADANPYLVLATALAGLHHGITNKIDPGPPCPGNAGETLDPGLPFRPYRALDALRASTVLPGYFGADYPATYAACKAKELESFEEHIGPVEYAWYLMAD